MYKEFEILEIFESIITLSDLNKVCNAFKYLIDNGFITTSVFLHRISHITFRRITNSEDYGKSKIL
ncbi:Hypothetical protein FP0828 [Flavobacterium psychrophilum JIP02/86]|uniref:Uncharacterized protein n=2 Tax=root TaxID=1 RepID=A6GXV5_FLAPJ|nr:hypothetical protein BOX10_gp55 [Flavobacterium phage 2A]AKC18998.1 hypothetical protein IY36_04215 [Flavobacterium psychrophilum]QCW20027.1 hypothetical protein [Flavobacterium phage FPSV-D15]QCW20783.1 hypothetical protein [Flavobacterium phage FPSV-D35]CAL42928.1 Hypothetical protein FP0828 [Flavobacterium psychrophilum JIP02/86]AKC21366.1 hypothetical protein IY37_04220 [Flavobacterium psychrophilum]